VNASRVRSPARRRSERTIAAAEPTARRRWKSSPDRHSFRRRYRTRAVPPACPPSLLSFSSRFVFRAFRGAVSRTALRRRGARRESMFERGQMSERVHGMTLRALPIRGPGAEQDRQPQRVQPGGFFRPLFGRSKRGHPDRITTWRRAPIRYVRRTDTKAPRIHPTAEAERTRGAEATGPIKRDGFYNALSSRARPT
jgi:hypothetical protein